MFLITAQYQESRSKMQQAKPGTLFLHVKETMQDSSGCNHVIDRKVSTGISIAGKNEIMEMRDELVPKIRLIYLIIERLHDSGGKYSIDDIMADYRRAVSGDENMSALVSQSYATFPLRAELASVGNSFKSAFSFVYATQSESGDLLDFIYNESQELKNQSRPSLSRSYVSLRNSLAEFLGGEILSFDNVGKDLVDKYSDWLSENGVSPSTQSFYLRTLRSVINHARKRGYIHADNDMFKGLNTKIKFDVPNDAQSVLPAEVLRKIADCDYTDEKNLELVRDMFLFGFYSRGMEFVDIFNLSKSCVKGNVLEYRRRSKGLLKRIPLDKSAMRIIRKYKDSSATYVFPLKEMYPGLQFHTVRDKVYSCMKTIGKDVGFPKLAFGMNISSWQQLANQVDMSELIMRGHG